MFEFLKNESLKGNCKSLGACSIDPVLNAIEEIILSTLKESSFYALKLKEINDIDNNVFSNITQGLSVVMIDSNFEQSDLIEFLEKIENEKLFLKEKYSNYCKKNHVPCESIEFEQEKLSSLELNELIKIGQQRIQNKYNSIELEKQRLFEFITFLSKSSAISIQMLKNYDFDTTDFDFELVRFFSLSNFLSTRSEKLKRRILEFSKINFEIENAINYEYKKAYGEKSCTTVQSSPIDGKSIMISGPDLNELDRLLDSIGDREINVYTNAQMYKAHLYSKFKEHKNLIADLTTDDLPSDFANFNGVILLTQNFSHKIDNLIRGTLFSNKIITSNKVFKIINNDYEPLIEAALNAEGYSDTEDSTSFKVFFKKAEIEEKLKEIKGKQVTIIVGHGNFSDTILDFNNKTLINIQCPLETELLFHTLETAKGLDIEIDLFMTNCSSEAISTLKNILFLNLKNIYITNCSKSSINPHILDCLKHDFDIHILK